MNRRWGIALAALAFFSAAEVEAQIPTPAEAQRLLSENPDLVRQRLAESGLSQAEIRARLSSMGFPTDALDAFLADVPVDPNSLDGSTLAALQALGVVVPTADGLEIVETVSGLMDAPAADSLRFPIFGHEMFTRASSQFQPLLSGPVSDDYQLGPGDQLLLILTGEAELAHELVVTREGAVIVPSVGRISVANLTMAEARALFRQRLAGSYSGIRRGTTSVNVTITELRTIQVYVTGEILQPGAYQLASVATVTNALYAAAGPTERGNLRDVRISRRDGDDATLDLYPYLLDGDVAGDITLEQGDVVFVPPRVRRVQLRGAVTRPASYDLTDEEDLYDALVAGAGFAPEANRSRITVHRVVRPGERGPGLGDRVAIDLGLTPSSDATETNHLGGVIIPPIDLQDGDSIVVDRVPDLADGFFVTITGMVAQPDMFPWTEGMTIRDLVNLARGPIVGADLREAEVSRLPDERSVGELADRLRVPLDSSYLTQRSPDGRYVGPPGVAFPPPGSSADFELQPYDQVLILRQPDFEMPQSVIVTGEVSVPGRYTLLTKNDRVTDLVDRAGHILENGYLGGAQLYRVQGQTGRIDLNLEEALTTPSSDENVLLMPGDSLHIPTYTPTVVVRGAVNSPGVVVLYRPEQDFDYYIAAAGGFRYDADKGRTSVRFANGLARTRSKFLFWSSYPTPDAGSVITVPTEDPTGGIDAVALTTGVLSVLGTITTLVIVLANNTGGS